MLLSGKQLDKLGSRLIADVVSDDDLRLLDDYRRSFSAASTAAVQLIRDRLGIEPTARPAKSKLAIMDKIRRQRTRLSTMQDIAGCRLVVDALASQRLLVTQLIDMFSIERQDDRVEQPSHGYRAHHLIAIVAGMRFEIQVRTELQHLWAAMSEKAADRHGHALKYGAGSATLQARLLALSEQVHDVEIGQDLLDLLSKRVATIGSPDLVLEHQEAMRMSWERRRILEADLEQLAAEPDNLVGEQ